MNTTAIIPARGGSKSIPLKNIKDFCGKPLIAWAILAAKGSKLIDRVIVSTDSEEIAKVAREYGAEIPFMRPPELAGDKVATDPVLKHSYEWLLQNEHYKADAIVLLQPTNPLRQTKHLDEAIRIFMEKKVDSVVAVNETPANHTPYWTLVRNEQGKVELFGGVDIKKILPQRQAFPQKCYARNDIVYVLKPSNLYETPSNLYGERLEMLETDPEYEVDINNPSDWELAEIRFEKLFARKSVS